MTQKQSAFDRAMEYPAETYYFGDQPSNLTQRGKDGMKKRCWYGLTGKRGGCRCHPIALQDLWWLQTVKEDEALSRAGGKVK